MMMTTNKDIRFYDTCSLLDAGEKIFDKEEHFLISSVTFQELERIKTANSKDADIKYTARLLLRLLAEHPDCYEMVIHKTEYEEPFKQYGVDITDDIRILSDAYFCNNCGYIDRVIFVTNDISLKHIALMFFGDQMIESIQEDPDDYMGYKEVTMTDEQLAQFYSNPTINHCNLHIGEYLVLRDTDNTIIDQQVWTGATHRRLRFDTLSSIHFGKIKPYNGDPYQQLLFDSLYNNKITLVKGPPGSGKTLISLAYLVSRLEKGQIDRIIVFCNTVATANSARLGFYPGTRNEKLLDSQIGNLLISKFGGRDEVERLISSEKLILLPMSDIRGYDTSGLNAGIYISEAQNLDISLIKLALQRIGEDAICIIDGDIKSQVDMPQFSGSNNGMRRVSKVYRGEDIYGEVQLQNIYRSRIAQIAERL